jgi:hypothetical protein
MAALDPFVLPLDVVIQPIARLPRELRGQVEHRPGDYSVTRPGTRSASTVVDAATAALLQHFRTASTIVDAIIAFSAREGRDPRRTLDDAFAILSGFVDDGFLVAADSELAQPIASSLAAGDHVGDFEILEPVQVLADTEVYRARASDGTVVALKIAGPSTGRLRDSAFAQEAAILGRLDGRVNPHLLKLGQHGQRPFLAVSWCDGVDVYQAAAEARGLDYPADCRALLNLAEDVIGAYAHLHSQGVLHGDIHPGNLLVDAQGAVTIIDFGLAAMPGTAAEPGVSDRGGIDFFLEPEFAAAALAGHPVPPLSPTGEQYSLGALIYLLLTGAHTQAFSLEQKEMLRQLCERPPLPFSRHNAPAMRAVERTVARALAKNPHARYRSVTNLLRSFRAAAAKDRQQVPAMNRPASTPAIVDEMLGRLMAPGEMFATGLTAATASVMNGAAGLAYALLRMARIRNDERLLAWADLWSTKAVMRTGSDDTFWNAEFQITPESFGTSSFYHHASGLHCVQSLIAHARHDDLAHQIAVESFMASAGESNEQIDIAFGQAGLLVGCSLSLEARPPAPWDEPLRALGNRLRDSLWARLSGQPALAASTELRSLGVAHGWAGYLFALLRWSEASATSPPPGLSERLGQLASLGRPVGRGLCWPPEVGLPAEAGLPGTRSALAASWCNGAAGYVHLWLLAHRQLGDEGYARLAQMAAWTVNEGPATGDLCCGLAGRAYALLSLYRHSGEPAWLARGRRLADQAVTSIRAKSPRPDSLYYGEVGVALLITELEAPEHGRMPLFEAEA